MDLIYIGKLVNTHGIKGEVKIISDFEYKEDVFKSQNNIYINNQKYKILSYRYHKIFDMVTLDGINSIDEALKIKGENVYIKKEDYNFSGFLNEELIGLDVYDGIVFKGKVIDILKTVTNDLLVVDGVKKHFVPKIPEFVKNVDLSSRKIYIEYIKGLDYED